MFFFFVHVHTLNMFDGMPESHEKWTGTNRTVSYKRPQNTFTHSFIFVTDKQYNQSFTKKKLFSSIFFHRIFVTSDKIVHGVPGGEYPNDIYYINW